MPHSWIHTLEALVLVVATVAFFGFMLSRRKGR